MINLFEKLIDCVQIPFFFLYLVSIAFLCIFKKRIGLFFLIVFLIGIGWRSLFYISAARYCAFAIVMGICSVIFAINHLRRKAFKSDIYVWLICLPLLLLNVLKLFSPFNNIYILDAKEELTHLLQKNEENRFFVEQKELKRITSVKDFYLSRSFTPDQDKNILNELDEYSLWGHPIYLLLFEKKGKEIDFSSFNFHKKTSIQKLCEFKTSRKKTKKLSLYLFMPSCSPEQENNIFYDSNSLIANGNFEQPEDKQKTHKKLKRWIESGITFYDSTEHCLPKNDYILETWETPSSQDSVPLVFSDSQNAINGTHSLNISFPEQKNTLVFLLYKIDSVPGKLSFLVKGLRSETIFSLARWDFTNEMGKTDPHSIYHFFLTDTKTHLIEIDVNKEDFFGKDAKSLFYLTGVNSSFLIDDLSFTPY